jgi:hypothetical protein
MKVIYVVLMVMEIRLVIIGVIVTAQLEDLHVGERKSFIFFIFDQKS